jgi:hypothetical protein
MQQLPRSVKYFWGLGVSFLLVLSIATEHDSKWLPLIHQAIDLLQLQMAPTSSK